MTSKRKRSDKKRSRNQEPAADTIKENKASFLNQTEVAECHQSQKRQRINQSLKSKLHVLTNAEEMELTAPTPGRITGAKNSNVWDFKLASLHGEKRCKIGSDSTPFVFDSPVIPSVEKLRHRCVSDNREHLKKLCREHNIIAPLMAWERWQSNCMLPQQLHSNGNSDRDSNIDGEIIAFESSTNNYTRRCRSVQHISLDYILPSAVGDPDDGLVQDLLRGGIENKTDAMKIATDLMSNSKQLVEKINAYSLSCIIPIGDLKTSGNKKKQKQQQQERSQAQAKIDLRPTVVNHKHTCDVSLGDNSKHVLKLNNAYYGKLWELYLLTKQLAGGEIDAIREKIAADNTSGGGNQNFNCHAAKVGKGEKDVLEAFHSSLYSLLARYNALLGHGMQCALPEDVFQTLHDHLQTNFECFASPLNCRYSSYCSAFPDTDSMFGSKGSFFDFFPTSGSYEVNPPFIESIMIASVEHAHKLLVESKDALSFVFIIPGGSYCCFVNPGIK